VYLRELVVVMYGILTIPHRNAHRVRIFPQFERTEQTRESLGDDTLQALLLLKTPSRHPFDTSHQHSYETYHLHKLEITERWVKLWKNGLLVLKATKRVHGCDDGMILVMDCRRIG